MYNGSNLSARAQKLKPKPADCPSPLEIFVRYTIVNTQKELTEPEYDQIMFEAKKIFEYQESVGNAYSMHVTVEWVNNEIAKVMGIPEKLMKGKECT